MQIPVKQPHRVIRYLQTYYVEYDSKSRINININHSHNQCINIDIFHPKRRSAGGRKPQTPNDVNSRSLAHSGAGIAQWLERRTRD